MQQWIQNYLAAQHRALDSILMDGIARLIEIVREAWQYDRQIFAIGNGSNAANASHFATDLGKGSSSMTRTTAASKTCRGTSCTWSFTPS